MTKLVWAAACWCLVFAAIPALIYGIFNAGVLGLFLAGIFLIFWPKFWPMLPLLPRRLLLVAVCAGIFFIAAVSAVMAHRAFFNGPPEAGRAAVIVPGSKINGDQPSLMLRRRLLAALGYLEANPGAVCVVTGGQGADEIMPEAAVMRRFLIERGVDEGRLFEEDSSTSTRGNFALARELLPEGREFIVVATDSFHQLRSWLFARAEFPGMEVYGISSSTPWGLLPSYWLRDLCGVVVAWKQTI